MTREQVSRLKSTPDPLVAPCETGRLASFNGVLSEVAPVPPSARKSRASERPPAQMGAAGAAGCASTERGSNAAT